MLIFLREKNFNIKIWKIILNFKVEINEYFFYNLFVVLLIIKFFEMLLCIYFNRLMFFCDICFVFCMNLN